MIKDLGIWTIKYLLSIYYSKIWQNYTLEIQSLKKIAYMSTLRACTSI